MQMEEKEGVCGNLQHIDQHVRHIDSESVPRIHILYDVDEFLRHQANLVVPTATQPSEDQSQGSHQANPVYTSMV